MTIEQCPLQEAKAHSRMTRRKWSVLCRTNEIFSMQIKPCNKSEPNADSEFILHSLKSLFIMYIINRLKRQFEMNIHRSMKQDPSTLQQQLPYLCKCYQDWSNRKTNYTALLREKISFAYSISTEIWKNEQYSE